jgi:N-acetylglutamate synthase-like GNAT family acetyltransferase
MKDQLKISEWAQPNFRAVNKFYRSQKHKGSASGDERVFIISLNDDIVAAVRLVPHDGYFWLRSLYVKSELRGQALGHTLLVQVRNKITRPIYCFPYTHLEAFYKNCGYALLTLEQLPPPLNQLFKKYKGKGDGIICMLNP